MLYDLHKKRVWIAGHNGMVGQALTRRLAQEDCTLLRVSRDDLDLRDQAAVRAWMETQRPDAIIIAAAKVGGIMANVENPATFFYDNMMIATNIMHAAYLHGVERLIALGSSCIYPRNAAQPITEDALLTAPLEPTNEAYAIAKIAALKMAMYYRTQYGCHFFSAMPCNLYGLGDTYDAHNSHVIPAMIMKAHHAKITGAEELNLWGTGTPLREFLNVDDLADALVMMLHHYDGDGFVNIGSGTEISIKDLAMLICKVVGYQGRVTFDSTKPDGMMRKVLDNSRIYALGWTHSTALEVGLAQAYDDYIAQYG